MPVLNKRSDLNVMELIPEHVAEATMGEDGLVSIRVPRFRNSFMRQWMTPRGKLPNVHTKLDEFGTCVWENCDGSRTVAEIADVLLERFGEEIQPVYERLGLYINQLNRYKYIRLLTRDGGEV